MSAVDMSTYTHAETHTHTQRQRERERKGGREGGRLGGGEREREREREREDVHTQMCRYITYAPSLPGGDSKVLMLVQLSPVNTNLPESLCSLAFAERAMGVELGCATPNRRKVALSQVSDAALL